MQPGIMEVMSSIQGEGIFVGERQLFIRLAGCNLRCQYCDTPGSFDYREPCRVETVPGRGELAFFPNPLKVDTIVGILKDLQPNLHHSVSLTGGEPLLYPEFIAALAPELHLLGLPVFLETNGTLPEALARVGKSLDIVSMDIKLPSTTGLAGKWHEHRDFLEIANKLQLDTYVKIVVAESTSDDELRQASDLVASVNQAIPFILQPVTEPQNREIKKPQPEQLLEFHALCRKKLDQVRVIPQTHKILGVL